MALADTNEIFWFERDKLTLRQKITRRKRLPTKRLVCARQLCDCDDSWRHHLIRRVKKSFVLTCDSFLKKDQVLNTSVAITCASNAAFILTARP